MLAQHMTSIEQQQHGTLGYGRYQWLWFPEHGLMGRPKATFASESAFLTAEHMALEVINDALYFRFAIVRHPWDRFVSAFRDKVRPAHNCSVS